MCVEGRPKEFLTSIGALTGTAEARVHWGDWARHENPLQCQDSVSKIKIPTNERLPICHVLAPTHMADITTSLIPELCRTSQSGSP